MDRRVLDYLMRREDSRRSRDNRRGDRADRVDYEDRRDYEDGRRRRSRRTGRYMRDRADMADYEDRRDYADERDYEDYGDYGDGHYGEMELKKSDMMEWKRMLRNADGSKGAHYDMQQVMQVADKLGIKFHDYDEKEFCMIVNVMYSDYCAVINKYIPHEKSLMFCAELAKAFLEDEDGPEPSEKVALYYYCIASCGEI